MDSAQRRFNNDRLRAAQTNLVGNLSAENSIRPTGGRVRKKPPGSSPPPVGPPRGQPADFNPIVDRDISQIPSGFTPMYDAPQQSAVPQQMNSSDQELDTLLRTIHTNKLVELPETARAYTKLKLRDYFHGRPSENIGQEVLQILRGTIKDE